MSCFVPGCGNTEETAAMFQFPPKGERREAWCESLGVDPLLDAAGRSRLLKGAVVCEEHFKLEDDTANFTYSQMMGAKIKLKKTAVPTVEKQCSLTLTNPLQALDEVDKKGFADVFDHPGHFMDCPSNATEPVDEVKPDVTEAETMRRVEEVLSRVPCDELPQTRPFGIQPRKRTVTNPYVKVHRLGAREIVHALYPSKYSPQRSARSLEITASILKQKAIRYKCGPHMAKVSLPKTSDICSFPKPQFSCHHCGYKAFTLDVLRVHVSRHSQRPPIRYTPRSQNKLCCVPTCRKSTEGNPDTLFFRVPRRLERWKKWCEVMRIHNVDFNNSKHRGFQICEDHFEEEDIVAKGGTVRLKRNTLPKPITVAETKPDPDSRVFQEILKYGDTTVTVSSSGEPPKKKPKRITKKTIQPLPPGGKPIGVLDFVPRGEPLVLPSVQGHFRLVNVRKLMDSGLNNKVDRVLRLRATPGRTLVPASRFVKIEPNGANGRGTTAVPASQSKPGQLKKIVRVIRLPPGANPDKLKIVQSISSMGAGWTAGMKAKIKNDADTKIELPIGDDISEIRDKIEEVEVDSDDDSPKESSDRVSSPSSTKLVQSGRNLILIRTKPVNKPTPTDSVTVDAAKVSNQPKKYRPGPKCFKKRLSAQMSRPSVNASKTKAQYRFKFKPVKLSALRRANIKAESDFETWVKPEPVDLNSTPETVSVRGSPQTAEGVDPKKKPPKRSKTNVTKVPDPTSESSAPVTHTPLTIKAVSARRNPQTPPRAVSKGNTPKQSRKKVTKKSNATSEPDTVVSDVQPQDSPKAALVNGCGPTATAEGVAINSVVGESQRAVDMENEPPSESELLTDSSNPRGETGAPSESKQIQFVPKFEKPTTRKSTGKLKRSRTFSEKSNDHNKDDDSSVSKSHKSPLTQKPFVSPTKQIKLQNPVPSLIKRFPREGLANRSHVPDIVEFIKPPETLQAPGEFGRVHSGETFAAECQPKLHSVITAPFHTAQGSSLQLADSPYSHIEQNLENLVAESHKMPVTGDAIKKCFETVSRVCIWSSASSSCEDPFEDELVVNQEDTKSGYVREWSQEPVDPPPFDFSGPKPGYVRVELSSPSDCFLHFLTPKLFEEICAGTNKNIQSVRSQMPQDGPGLVTFEELASFFAVLLLHFATLGGVAEWLGDYGLPVGACLTFDRFKFLLEALSFSTEGNSPKSSLLLEYFNKRMSLIANPPKELLLNDAATLRNDSLVYSRFVDDSANQGVLYNLSGRDGTVHRVCFKRDKVTPNGPNVFPNPVMDALLNGLLDQGYSLYMNNFYCSVQLAEELLRKQTYCTGTLTNDRKVLPDQVKFSPQKSKISSVTSYYTQDGVCFTKWNEGREFMCVSSEWGAKMAGDELPRPELFHRYKEMTTAAVPPMPRLALAGSADVKLTLQLLAMLVRNAFIMYSSKSSSSFKDFQFEIARHLLSYLVPVAISTSVQSHLPALIEGLRHNSDLVPRKMCDLCEERATVVFCNGCDGTPSMCRNCYKSEHEQMSILIFKNSKKA